MVKEMLVKCTCNCFTDCVNVQKKCQLSDHVLRMSENAKIYLSPVNAFKAHSPVIYEYLSKTTLRSIKYKAVLYC